MFTGQLPSEHGFHRHNNDFANLSVEDTFLEDLPHRTIGISANVFAGPKYGFDSIFDEFAAVSTGKRYSEGMDPNRYFLDHEGGTPSTMVSYFAEAIRSDHPVASMMNGVAAAVNVASRDAPIPKLIDDGASVITSKVLQTLRASGDQSFVFTNFADAHVPLRPIRGFDRSLFDAPLDWSTDTVDVWDVMGNTEEYKTFLKHHRELYAAAIDYLDQRIAELIQKVRASVDTPTTVIITADHGENLGEPENEGLIGHKSSLSEALLHVPFYVIDPPENVEVTADGYASLRDLGTLVKAFDVEKDIHVGHEHVYAEVVGMSPGPEPNEDRKHWDRMLRAAYGNDKKYVWDSLGAHREYTVDRDQPCSQELVREDIDLPEWTQKPFASDIDTYKKAARQETHRRTVDKQTEHRLEDLGYR
jgi:hypothetical protein